MKTLLPFLERALLLAPKNSGLYALAARLDVGFRDEEALRKLLNRFRTSNVNLSESNLDMLDFYAGKKDAKNRQGLEEAGRRVGELLEKPELRQHPATHQYLLDQWVENRIERAALLGESVDSLKVLAAAETACREHPCSYSLGTLQAACLFAARVELARENAAFATLAGRTRRALSDECLLALVLERNDAVAAAVRANGQFKRAVKLMIEGQQKFPEWPDPSEWAILNSVAPETAAALVAGLKKSGARQVALDLRREMHPLNTSTILDHYFRCRMLGDTKGADECYAKAVREGVPLPPR
jgi:hypothetical protein